MASTAINAEQKVQGEDRRFHPRSKAEQLAYVACGSDNGGILIDLSEGGLSFQGVGMLSVGEQLDLKLMLPTAPHPLQVPGQVVWLNDSGKGGGLQFLNLPDGARLQVVEWISSASRIATADSAAPSAAESPARPMPSPMDDLDRWEQTGVAASQEAAAEPPSGGALEAGSAAIKPRAGRTPFLDSLRMTRTAGDASAQPAPAQSVQKPQAETRIREFALPSPVREQEQEERPAAAIKVETVTPVAPAVARAEREIVAPVAAPAAREIKVPLSATPAGAVVNRSEFVLSEPHPGSSRALKLILSAALGCALAAGAIFGVRAFRAFSRESATPQQAPAEAETASHAQKPFQVQVQDDSDGPWTLRIGAGDPAPVRNSSAVAPPPSSPVNVAPPAKPSPSAKPAVRARVASLPAIPRTWGLRLPSPIRRTTVSKNLDAPAVGNSASLAANAVNLSSVAAGSALPAPPPAPAKPSFEQAELIHRVAPMYSQLALQQRVEGVVDVALTIGEDGVPQSLRVISGDPRLAGSALAAIRNWRYRPATLGGKPVETRTDVKVQFRLNP